MQENIRQLAAIMFTDIAGYTALMQSDEDQAKTLRKRHRSILENRIRGYHGLILQYYGDGSLSVFGSAIEAVECAVRIQLEMQQSPAIPLRIGLNIGDIVYDDDGIYGDGVNVASRIESMSVPGSVIISEKVYDEIKNHPEYPVVSLGKHKLKNVTRPVEIFALNYSGLVIPDRQELSGKISQELKSIAVLPFVNMSSDRENEYFSDGISEEIINALSRLDGLQVTSRTSAFAFKGKNIDVREIGAQLNVHNVLEGSVRRSGQKIRVTAQLINAGDGYHLWSEVYNRDMEDIFELQDEISRKITQTLREKLSVREREEVLVAAPTQNIDAYNTYLKGKYYWNRWSPEDVGTAIKVFSQAITMQPDFALPYSGLASCYCFLGAINYLPPDEVYPKARENALKAIELDPSKADSHIALAMVHYFFDWDWDAAEACFKKAFELNPGSAEAHNYYSMFLTTLNRSKEALQEALAAHKLDPLAAPVNHNLANAYAQNMQFEEAVKQYQRTLELDANFRTGLYGLGWAYLALGKKTEALDTFQTIYNRLGDELKGTANLAYLHAVSGEQEKALEYLYKLQKRAERDKAISLDMDFAMVYEGFGDYDKVFYYLEKALEKRLGSMVFIMNVHWRNIHKDKRFKKILSQMGLPDIKVSKQ